MRHGLRQPPPPPQRLRHQLDTDISAVCTARPSAFQSRNSTPLLIVITGATMHSSKSKRSAKSRLCARKVRPSKALMMVATSASTGPLLQKKSKRSQRSTSNLSLPSLSITAKNRALHRLHPTSQCPSRRVLPRSQRLRRCRLRAPRPNPSQPRLLSHPRSLPPRLPPSSPLHPRALQLNHPQVSQVRLPSRPCPLLCPQFLFPRQSR